MNSKLVIVAALATGITVSFLSCKKEDAGSAPEPVTTYLDLPQTPYNYGFFSQQDNYAANLGRVLFYDAHLSVNNSISCASCHKQAMAFSDNVALSRGFQNRLTSRNSPPIQNVGGNFQNGFPNLFWDGREASLFSMVLKPIVNHVEMGMNDGDALVNKVKGLSYYSDLFTNAFGSDEVNATRIANALSLFVGSITSSHTRFDNYEMGLTKLSGPEEMGRSLFFNKYNCNSCHRTEELNGYQMGGGFVNIGLETNYTDIGRAGFTKDQNDVGKFKIPNLRNVALTAPYMHDGRFATLDEVLEHYSHGIQDHPNLDPRLRDANNNPMVMNISTLEKTSIIAFLNTLTDYAMITDVKFSSPFKIR